jgi:hypothetical protein
MRSMKARSWSCATLSDETVGFLATAIPRNWCYPEKQAPVEPPRAPAFKRKPAAVHILGRLVNNGRGLRPAIPPKPRNSR